MAGAPPPAAVPKGPGPWVTADARRPRAAVPPERVDADSLGPPDPRHPPAGATSLWSEGPSCPRGPLGSAMGEALRVPFPPRAILPTPCDPTAPFQPLAVSLGACSIPGWWEAAPLAPCCPCDGGLPPGPAGELGLASSSTPVLPLGPGDAPAPPSGVLHRTGPPLLCHPPTTALTLSQWFLPSCPKGMGLLLCEWSGRVTALSTRHPLRPQTPSSFSQETTSAPRLARPGQRLGRTKGRGSLSPPLPASDPGLGTASVNREQAPPRSRAAQEDARGARGTPSMNELSPWERKSRCSACVYGTPDSRAQRGTNKQPPSRRLGSGGDAVEKPTGTMEIGRAHV